MKTDSIKGWFFCFPNLEAEIGGVWKKGVAVRLYHGTVITWDARLIQHCTSLPHLDIDKETKLPKSMSHGTYFGMNGIVASNLKRKQEEEKTIFNRSVQPKNV